MDFLKRLYLLFISLFDNEDNNDGKVRLQREEEPTKLDLKIDYKMIILMVVMLLIFLILIWQIYKTGSLESTNYYYRLYQC